MSSKVAVDSRTPRQRRLSHFMEQFGVYVVLGVVLCTLWGLVIGFSIFQKQKQLDNAQIQLEQLRNAVKQHTEALFQSIDTNLHIIDLWLQTHPNIDPLTDAPFLALVSGVRQASQGLIDPRMVSVKGGLHYLPARDTKPLADVRDRDYFREALKLGPGKLYVGDPVLSRVTGKWGIPISMQLTHPVGGMQVVFAAVELAHLQDFHEQFRRKPTGSVVLMRDDGMMLSRTPFVAKVVGRNLQGQPAIQHMFAVRTGVGFTESPATDGQRRMVAFDHLTHGPIFVAVTWGEEDILATYYERRSTVVTILLLISLATTVMAWRLQQAQNLSRLLREDTLKAAALMQAATNALPLGQFQIDAQGELVAVNQAWREIHGLTGTVEPNSWPTPLAMAPDAMTGFIDPHGYLLAGEHTLVFRDGRAVLLRVRRADIVVEGQIVGCSGTVEDITERRTAQKNQRMLMDALDQSTDVVVQTDVEGHLLYVNAAFRRFVGCTADAPLDTLDVRALLGEQYLLRRSTEMMPNALGQGAWQSESVLWDAQGMQRILSHLLIANRAADGTVTHFTGILRDITEQKLAESRILESELRLRSIADNVPCLIAEIGNDYVYRFANRAYEDWLGINSDDIVGRTLAQVLGDEVFQVVGPHHAAAFRGERVNYVREARHGGQSRWLRISLAPRFSGSGRPDGCFAIGFDITESRKAGEALRQSEQRLRDIADRLPMRLSVVDREERYRFLNLAYERAFSRPREALYGMTVREVLGEGAYGLAAPYLQRALRGEVVSFESEVTTAEGYRCYKADYIPQYAEDRTVMSFVAIVTDTTGQKLEERRLIALSQRDSLTGLLNRAGFDVRLREAVLRAEAERSCLALLYLDVDHFKQVNDGQGHLVGDLLLQGFAGRLNKIVRATDTVARLGGDEFAILLESLDNPASAAHVARNLVEAMREPFLLENQAVRISTSIGVALYAGDGTMTPRELVRRADEQLYQAKAAGRDDFRVVSQPAA